MTNKTFKYLAFFATGSVATLMASCAYLAIHLDFAPSDGSIKIKKFPNWMNAVLLERDTGKIILADNGSIMKCKDGRFGVVEGVFAKDGFWFIYSGSGNAPINDIDGVFSRK